MKRIFLPLFIVTYAVILSGILILQTGSLEDSRNYLFTEYFYVGIISIFFILAIYIGYKRMKRKKEGFPEEDELSRKIAQKGAAASFYLSLFLWLALIYIRDRSDADIRIFIGYGMIGMALIFVFSRFFYQYKGLLQ